jgi:hypothetical protein
MFVKVARFFNDGIKRGHLGVANLQAPTTTSQIPITSFQAP